MSYSDSGQSFLIVSSRRPFTKSVKKKSRSTLLQIGGFEKQNAPLSSAWRAKVVNIMFEQFRLHYPKGSLITELLEIDRGQYIVRCLVQVEGVTLVTGLAAAQTVELAEDRARERALAALSLDSQAVTPTASPTPQAPAAVAPPTTPEAIPHPQGNQTSYDLEFMAKKAARTTTVAPSPREEQPLTEVDAVPESETVPEPELPLPPEPVAIPSLEQEAPAYTPSQQEEAETFEPPSNGTTTAFVRERPTEISEEIPPSSEPIDFSDIIARTTVELKRLGWTNQQGREYLVQTYGKRSRQLLTDEELLDFLHHLESEPTPQEQQTPQE
jgi:hypothetical protein